jgi:hypothetical protein
MEMNIGRLFIGVLTVINAKTMLILNGFSMLRDKSCTSTEDNATFAAQIHQKYFSGYARLKIFPALLSLSLIYQQDPLQVNYYSHSHF